MPRISAFYGIVITMYWDETHHQRPHFHARYAGRVASIAFDGEVLAGRLPRRVVERIAEWARLHREELDANWARARSGRSLEPIGPLP